MTHLFNKRLAALRGRMTAHGFDAYIIPSSDAHQSEYVAAHYQSRSWLTGFTGSMANALATNEFAGVWTDVRYFLQAEQELANSDWSLQRMKVQGAPEYLDWLKENLADGSTIGFDGKLFTIGQMRNMEKEFEGKDIKLAYKQDLISEIWTEDRPTVPKKTIFEHDVKYSGASRTEKLAKVREKMKTQKADFHLISTLDDIGWLYNLRGYDVACNPVFYAFAIVGQDSAYLFIENRKVSSELKASLEKDGITVKLYLNVESFLEILPAEKSILIDTTTTSVYLYDKITAAKIIEGDTIPLVLKAIKNETEIEGTKNAMRKDGVALVKAFRWLEREIKKRSISEVELAQKLQYFRSRMPLYYGESFDAIVGYKGNGAIIHYRPEEGKCAFIENNGILLIDSGGQYQDGTTDITRTLALSEPTAEQKKAYTLVLKGHITLAKLKFPHGTKGVQMDILARMALWQHGLNYGHGTGHGVGCFMNVHEPPQGFITGVASRGTTVHEIGMLSSNEPGYYKTDEYGIRIENLMFVVAAEENDGTQFLKFDNVTLFPIDTTLIDKNLMSKEERRWLNDYHMEVLEKLSPDLSAGEIGWLKRKCKAI
jgi:Xaa-Pro aminopeptidase